MFNADRLKMARQRRKLSGKGLAERSKLTSVTVSKVENGHEPDVATVEALASALGYPVEYFYRQSPHVLESDTVSFRSLSKMSASEKHASLAAGSLGVELYEWIEAHFNLPQADLIDLSKERDRPEVAARLLRQHWGLGDRPVANVMKLLESKGVRVLSLSENTRNVDAYSFWKDEHPYIFLNQGKTAERSIFDSSHELAHLVLHHHAGARNERDAETQADQFASAFLMPETDVRAYALHVRTANQVIAMKRRWKVSAMAMARRLRDFGLTDWQLRSLYIELGQLGYRTGEPLSVERETSTVMAKVLSALWSRRQTKASIAKDLNVPLEEIENLVFRLAGPAPAGKSRQGLSLIPGGRV